MRLAGPGTRDPGPGEERQQFALPFATNNIVAASQLWPLVAAQEDDCHVGYPISSRVPAP
jgi:hypothetical protein